MLERLYYIEDCSPCCISCFYGIDVLPNLASDDFVALLTTNT